MNPLLYKHEKNGTAKSTAAMERHVRQTTEDLDTAVYCVFGFAVLYALGVAANILFGWFK